MNDLAHLARKIRIATDKFSPDLTGAVVLTEAASGNYVVTSIMAALAGAGQVYAFTKDSRYGLASQVEARTMELAHLLGVENRVHVTTDESSLPWERVDVLTNTGFNRPIDEEKTSRLDVRCVIPLMWEPWEYRAADLDLEACRNKGIKVYGTNEADPRLRTMEYIGFTALRLLLDNGLSPFSGRILVLGCPKFSGFVVSVLTANGYLVDNLMDYSQTDGLLPFNIYDSIILVENEDPRLLIGPRGAVIDSIDLRPDQVIVHITGNVDFSGAHFKHIPEHPSAFGYMSFTTDYVDSQAVIDLHCAGLKVAEGMIKANALRLSPAEYKQFMEQDYPALAFEDPRYW